MRTLDEVMELFAYKHLPHDVQKVSKGFHDMACELFTTQRPTAELTLCLRKLWEAKNYAVWCAVNRKP